MELHEQETCVFDDIKADLAGDQMGPKWGPCWQPGAVLVVFHSLTELQG